MNTGNLTRKELTEALTTHLGYPQSTCSELIDTFLDKMKQTLLAGEPIKFVHFGTFNIRDKQPRRGRNPRTGETITIKQRQMISFRPSKKMREQINE